MRAPTAAFPKFPWQQEEGKLAQTRLISVAFPFVFLDACWEAEGKHTALPGGGLFGTEKRE